MRYLSRHHDVNVDQSCDCYGGEGLALQALRIIGLAPRSLSEVRIPSERSTDRLYALPFVPLAELLFLRHPESSGYLPKIVAPNPLTAPAAQG